MKLSDNGYSFTNYGDPPVEWTAIVSGDSLISPEYGSFSWDPVDGCYVNDDPIDPPTAEVQRLHVYANGNFGLISLPPGQGAEAGDWR